MIGSCRRDRIVGVHLWLASAGDGHQRSAVESQVTKGAIFEGRRWQPELRGRDITLIPGCGGLACHPCLIKEVPLFLDRGAAKLLGLLFGAANIGTRTLACSSSTQNSTSTCIIAWELGSPSSNTRIIGCAGRRGRDTLPNSETRPNKPGDSPFCPESRFADLRQHPGAPGPLRHARRSTLGPGPRQSYLGKAKHHTITHVDLENRLVFRPPQNEGLLQVYPLRPK